MLLWRPSACHCLLPLPVACVLLTTCLFTAIIQVSVTEGSTPIASSLHSHRVYHGYRHQWSSVHGALIRQIACGVANFRVAHLGTKKKPEREKKDAMLAPTPPSQTARKGQVTMPSGQDRKLETRMGAQHRLGDNIHEKKARHLSSEVKLHLLLPAVAFHLESQPRSWFRCFLHSHTHRWSPNQRGSKRGYPSRLGLCLPAHTNKKEALHRAKIATARISLDPPVIRPSVSFLLVLPLGGHESVLVSSPLA